MKATKYDELVKNLVASGTDFTRSVYALSGSELGTFHDLARRYGYRKPLMFSRGFGFYLLLQRVYRRLGI